ncbi:hypothetical protein ASE48_22510 [Mycobacterium sp. Root265]|uniref:AAA family ATPase n=1 Tax=Mycobacterium sp. Root265 TaxID=1736504 RepID=UPI00070A5328|nr:AAA family ATPase [Mycobacterium sp. Root265]KRD19799.1 hypothetical protein ASE48_22510 [Mycobacterium sp. Root265]
MTDLYDFADDDKFADYLNGERMATLAREMVRQERAQARWHPPEPSVSLAEELAGDLPEVDWIVRDLAPSGVVQVNAAAKSGKTTLALNLVQSLVTGDPFLGRFDVNFGTLEQVGYFNMELGKRQMLQWCADLNLPEDAGKRVWFYHAREHGFGAMDLSNPQAVEWIIKWLVDHGITYAVWDPLSKLFNPGSWGGGDINAAYNAFWVVLETIMREAKLRGMFIAHHTGFSEEAGDRARGASAMMDCPDVNIAFRLGTDSNGQPDRRGPRHFKAVGRDVDVADFEVGYTVATRTLSATGRANRTDLEAEREALRARDVVARWQADGRNPNKGELFGELGWEMTGRGQARCQSWYARAQHRDYIRIQKISSAKIHTLGDGEPEADEDVVRLSDRRKQAPKRSQNAQ